MTHYSPLFPPASLPLLPSLRINSEQKLFVYSLESLQGCCAEACEAARAGRYSIAHGLFQNALVFFDHARNATWDDADDIYRWQHTWHLSRARGELDECAALIYTDEVAQGSRAWPASAQGRME